MSNPFEEVLEWYREMVGDCNRHGDPGPAARDKLAKDRGGKAAEALAVLRSGEMVVVDGERLQNLLSTFLYYIYWAGGQQLKNSEKQFENMSVLELQFYLQRREEEENV